MGFLLMFLFFIVFCILLAPLLLAKLGIRFLQDIRRTFVGDSQDGQQMKGNRQRTSTGSRQTSSASRQHEKIFGDDEGQYVDFEEVKN